MWSKIIKKVTMMTVIIDGGKLKKVEKDDLKFD